MVEEQSVGHKVTSVQNDRWKHIEKERVGR